MATPLNSAGTTLSAHGTLGQSEAVSRPSALGQVNIEQNLHEPSKPVADPLGKASSPKKNAHRGKPSVKTGNQSSAKMRKPSASFSSIGTSVGALSESRPSPLVSIQSVKDLLLDPLKVRIIPFSRSLAGGNVDTSERLLHEEEIVALQSSFGDSQHGLTATARTIFACLRLIVVDIIRRSIPILPADPQRLGTVDYDDLLFVVTLDPARRARVRVFLLWSETGRKRTLEDFMEAARQHRTRPLDDRDPLASLEDRVASIRNLLALYQDDSLISNAETDFFSGLDDTFVRHFEESFINRYGDWSLHVQNPSAPEVPAPCSGFAMCMRSLLDSFKLEQRTVNLMGFLVWDALRTLVINALVVKRRQEEFLLLKQKYLQLNDEAIEGANSIVDAARTPLMPSHIREALRRLHRTITFQHDFARQP